MGRKGIILNIKDKLEESALNRKLSEGHRSYLGFSMIGHECKRYLWLHYHHPELSESPSGNLCRIWENGKEIEHKILSELVSSGYNVSGFQIKNSLLGGLFCGHNDGIIEIDGEKYILEIKSASDRNFKLFQKHGVRQHPIYGSKYYAQGILYSGCEDLQGTLYIIENKNNQDIYTEIVYFNPDDFEKLVDKAESIIFSGVPPTGISYRKDWYQCIHCEFNTDEACRKTWEGESDF